MKVGNSAANQQTRLHYIKCKTLLYALRSIPKVQTTLTMKHSQLSVQNFDETGIVRKLLLRGSTNVGTILSNPIVYEICPLSVLEEEKKQHETLQKAIKGRNVFIINHDTIYLCKSIENTSIFNTRHKRLRTLFFNSKTIVLIC